MNGSEGYEGLVHTTPLEVACFLLAWGVTDTRLAYSPALGQWMYVHQEGNDISHFNVFGVSPLVMISTTQINTLVRRNILLIPRPDLSDEEFAVQSGLGTAEYSKIRYLRPGITIEEIKSKLQP